MKSLFYSTYFGFVKNSLSVNYKIQFFGYVWHHNAFLINLSSIKYVNLNFLFTTVQTVILRDSVIQGSRTEIESRGVIEHSATVFTMHSRNETRLVLILRSK